MAFDTAAVRYVINSVTADDWARTIKPGDIMWIFADEACWFEVRKGVQTPPVGATTVMSGARPGTFLAADAYFTFVLDPLATTIEILKDSTAGTAVLYLGQP